MNIKQVNVSVAFSLEQGTANFSTKGHVINNLGFEAMRPQPCHCSTKSNHRQYVQLIPTKLCTKTGGKVDLAHPPWPAKGCLRKSPWVIVTIKSSHYVLFFSIDVCHNCSLLEVWRESRMLEKRISSRISSSTEKRTSKVVPQNVPATSSMPKGNCWSV